MLERGGWVVGRGGKATAGLGLVEIFEVDAWVVGWVGGWEEEEGVGGWVGWLSGGTGERGGGGEGGGFIHIGEVGGWVGRFTYLKGSGGGLR